MTALENGAIRLRSGDRELRLPTERAVKLTHDYVEGTGGRNECFPDSAGRGRATKSE